MRFALDTNRLSDFLGGAAEAIDQLQLAERLYVPVVYARIFAGWRKRGTPIPQNDLWIGALALQHDLPLYSRDAHFQLVPEVRLV